MGTLLPTAVDVCDTGVPGTLLEPDIEVDDVLIELCVKFNWDSGARVARFSGGSDRRAIEEDAEDGCGEGDVAWVLSKGRVIGGVARAESTEVRPEVDGSELWSTEKDE